MNANEWIEKAEQNQESLRHLIKDWHPSAREPRAIQKHSILFTDGTAVAVDVPEAHMNITAPNAEIACQNIRQQIRQDEPQDPVARFNTALKNKDISELTTVLNGAWFGVPESTSCWSIRGFKEAVELLEDPPDDVEFDDEGNEVKTPSAINSDKR